MRILLLIKRFNFGGSENHICDLANELAKRGHNVFLLGRPGQQNQRLNPLVRFYPFYMRDVAFIPHMFFLQKFIRRHDIEIIHAHQRLAIKYAAFAGLLSSTPTAASVHGKTRNDLGGYFCRKLLSRVIFVSNHVLRCAMRFRDLRNKSTFIPNGVNLGPAHARRSTNEIVYISRINKRHGNLVVKIIEQVLPYLVALYPDVRFKIIGDGRWADAVHRAADRFNKACKKPAVECVGFKDEANQSLADAALVMGVGRVAANALMQGIPVLSINHRRLGSFISRENYSAMLQSNFVDVAGDPPRAEVVLSRLSCFFKDPEKQRNDAIKVRALIARDLDQKTIVSSIESVYRQMMVEVESAKDQEIMTAFADKRRPPLELSHK